MTKTFTIIAQIVGIILQLGNALSGVVPPKYQFLVAGIIGVLQAVQGMLAHSYNPDGTPATQPYVPKP